MVKENLKRYAEYLNVSLRNLLYFKDNKDVYKVLYYNRTRDIDKMKSIFRGIHNRGDNILITGPAGTGKTNFIYRVFFETKFLEENNLYPIIVDFGESYSYEVTLLNFIRDMKTFFDSVEFPINRIKENDTKNLQQNLHIIRAHLRDYYYNNGGKIYLLIFLDDLDYMEDRLYDLLEQFYSIGSCKHVSIVLSARPKLYLSIYHYDDRFSIFFTRNVERIKLKPLPVEKIIAKRLAYILEQKKESNNFILHIIKSFFEKKDIYLKAIEKMGIKDIEDLEKIPLPFSTHLSNFMSVITNNNIREILELTHDLLVYILENYDELEDITEEREGIIVTKKYIHEEQLLYLLSKTIDDDSVDEELLYRRSFNILNIHKVINTKGNSLYFNILEAIRAYEIIDQRIYNVLQKLGHTKNEIDDAIILLSNKAHRLVVEKRFVPQIYRSKNGLLHQEYHLTEKGDYYLSNINYWQCYRDKYGFSNKSLKDII